MTGARRKSILFKRNNYNLTFEGGIILDKPTDTLIFNASVTLFIYDKDGNIIKWSSPEYINEKLDYYLEILDEYLQEECE